MLACLPGSFQTKPTEQPAHRYGYGVIEVYRLWRWGFGAGGTPIYVYHVIHCMCISRHRTAAASISLPYLSASSSLWNSFLFLLIPIILRLFYRERGLLRCTLWLASFRFRFLFFFFLLSVESQTARLTFNGGTQHTLKSATIKLIQNASNGYRKHSASRC